MPLPTPPLARLPRGCPGRRLSHLRLGTLLVGVGAMAPAAAAAQGHVHTPGMTHPAPAAAPALAQGGEAAFAAIAEVVALLEADPATDWSRVRIDRLRDHLADMHRVTVEARVTARDVPGGAAYAVTGSGPVAAAIRRMAAAHAAMTDGADGVRVTVAPLPAGARVAVTAADPGDARAVARLRALGFHGWLALGNHHAAHHLALARGDAMPDHSSHAPPGSQGRASHRPPR